MISTIRSFLNFMWITLIEDTEAVAFTSFSHFRSETSETNLYKKEVSKNMLWHFTIILDINYGWSHN